MLLKILSPNIYVHHEFYISLPHIHIWAFSRSHLRPPVSPSPSLCLSPLQHAQCSNQKPNQNWNKPKLNPFSYYMLLAMQFQMAKWFRRGLKYDARKFSWYLVLGYLTAVSYMQVEVRKKCIRVRESESESECVEEAKRNKKKMTQKQRRCSESFMANRKDWTDKIMRKWFCLKKIHIEWKPSLTLPNSHNSFCVHTFILQM